MIDAHFINSNEKKQPNNIMPIIESKHTFHLTEIIRAYLIRCWNCEEISCASKGTSAKMRVFLISFLLSFFKSKSVSETNTHTHNINTSVNANATRMQIKTNWHSKCIRVHSSILHSINYWKWNKNDLHETFISRFAPFSFHSIAYVAVSLLFYSCIRSFLSPSLTCFFLLLIRFFQIVYRVYAWICNIALWFRMCMTW